MRVYEAILADFSKFKLQNKDYFQRALQNEKDHRAAWSKALGFKKPTGFTLHVPAGGEEHPLLLGTGVALEAAFVETHLGAVKSFSSTELKLAAAEVASTEATHFSFSDAAFGGHTVLPSFPGNIPASAAGAATGPAPGRARASRGWFDPAVSACDPSEKGMGDESRVGRAVAPVSAISGDVRDGSCHLSMRCTEFRRAPCARS